MGLKNQQMLHTVYFCHPFTVPSPDVVVSAVWHPALPLAAVAQGSRKFPDVSELGFSLEPPDVKPEPDAKPELCLEQYGHEIKLGKSCEGKPSQKWMKITHQLGDRTVFEIKNVMSG